MKILIIFALLLSVNGINAQEKPAKTQLLRDFFHITKDSQSDYPIKDIHQGCPAVDCIPSIDKPEFIKASQVDFIGDDDLIMAVTVGNQTRVYPTTTLQQHEIVNDQIGDVPFAVTYCPLCGTGVAFSRQVNGKVVEFGVSGVLHGSDLVMYDRKNKNLWQQLTGKAFAGPNRGYQLKTLPVIMTDWKTWKPRHLNSMVLSNSKDKIKDHYSQYRNSDKVMFGGVTDPRIKPKRVVIGFKVNTQAVAIDLDLIKKRRHFELKVDDTVLRIQYLSDGEIVIQNKADKTLYELHRSYWFAWYTFNPQTRLFKLETI
jgi:hypothetical protein